MAISGLILDTPSVTRGVCRVMMTRGYSPITELMLPNGRRLDVIGVAEGGAIAAVEIKCSVEDFRGDTKWPEYLEFCDSFFFAVPEGFPTELLPAEHGLIIADRFGGAVMREAPMTPMPTPRRKALMLRFARIAADRLARSIDPDFSGQ
jgi:hypothetical protein